MKNASHLVMFRWLLWRELVLVWRRKSDVMSMLAFFVIIASLFPLGLDPDSRLLRNIAPGVVWVSALLASMLGLGRLFSADYTDGTLEQMLDHPTASSPDRGRKNSGAMLVDGNTAGADLASSGASIWIVAERNAIACHFTADGNPRAESDWRNGLRVDDWDSRWWPGRLADCTSAVCSGSRVWCSRECPSGWCSAGIDAGVCTLGSRVGTESCFGVMKR